MGHLIGPLSSTKKVVSFVILMGVINDVVQKVDTVIKWMIESSSPRLVAKPRPTNYAVAKCYVISRYTNAGASVG